MRKVAGLILLLTVIGMIFTRSLYVELNEFLIIVISLSIISTIVSFNYRKQGEADVAKGVTAFIGLVLFWVLALVDLIGDHFLYFLPTGKEDGMALTLGMKIDEFSDDLFILFLINGIAVFIIFLFISKLFSMNVSWKRD